MEDDRSDVRRIDIDATLPQGPDAHALEPGRQPMKMREQCQAQQPQSRARLARMFEVGPNRGHRIQEAVLQQARDAARIARGRRLGFRRRVRHGQRKVFGEAVIRKR